MSGKYFRVLLFKSINDRIEDSNAKLIQGIDKNITKVDKIIDSYEQKF